MHATQFFEFVKAIAGAATDGNTVRLAPVLIQPMASDDLVRRALTARKDPREVVADGSAKYFNADLGERTLLPEPGAYKFETRFDDWLGSLPA